MQLIIDEESSVNLTGSESLGVTYESEVGILSLEFTDSGVTFFRNVPYSSSEPPELMFPLVGNAYKFEYLHVPSILSIGAVIQEGKSFEFIKCFFQFHGKWDLCKTMGLQWRSEREITLLASVLKNFNGVRLYHFECKYHPFIWFEAGQKMPWKVTSRG